MDFGKLVEEILQENNVIGGPSSVMGPGVVNTASAVSGDKYEPGDARVVKNLFGKGNVLTRYGMKSSNKKKKKKK
jgi:hypothetical protein